MAAETKKRRYKVRIHQGGFTLMEILVAALLVVVVLVGLMRIWQFSYNMTLSTDDRGVAYNLARQAIENFRTTGFNNSQGYSTTSPVTVTTYYGADGRNGSSTPSASTRYRLDVTVTTDRIASNASGSFPAPLALRQVVATVRLHPAGTVLHSVGSLLARSGV